MKSIGVVFAVASFLVVGANFSFAQSNAVMPGATAFPSATNQTSTNSSVLNPLVKKEQGMSIGDKAAWANAIAATVTAIAAIANILLVWWLFLLADRKHGSERTDDFRDREAERKVRVAGFWIEELIMRPNHPLLIKFFDDYEARLKMPPKLDAAGAEHAGLVKQAGAEIEQFKSQYHTIRHRVIEPLQWVNKGFAVLTDVLSEIEDLVTTELSMIPGVPRPETINGQNKKSAQDRLAELRQKFFQTIHEIQKQAVLVYPPDSNDSSRTSQK